MTPAPTLQEFFDKTALHLFQQGEQAMVHQSCAYRTPEGLKCAVGVHIPDELYEPRIECFTHGSEEHDMLTGGEVIIRLLKWKSPTLVSLANDLQLVHDRRRSWLSPQTLNDELRQVARDFKLKPEILDDPRCSHFGLEPPTSD